MHPSDEREHDRHEMGHGSVDGRVGAPGQMRALSLSERALQLPLLRPQTQSAGLSSISLWYPLDERSIARILAAFFAAQPDEGRLRISEQVLPILLAEATDHQLELGLELL